MLFWRPDDLPLLEPYPDNHLMRRRCRSAENETAALHATLHPGDAIFFPSRWWAVLNRRAVSITRWQHLCMSAVTVAADEMAPMMCLSAQGSLHRDHLALLLCDGAAAQTAVGHARPHVYWRRERHAKKQGGFTQRPSDKTSAFSGSQPSLGGLGGASGASHVTKKPLCRTWITPPLLASS